jgi:hypothetical protein
MPEGNSMSQSLDTNYQLSRSDIEKICHIINTLILTKNPSDPFTKDEIETLINANKYLFLFFTELCQGINGDFNIDVYNITVGGGIQNALFFVVALVLLFNTFLVDAYIVKEPTFPTLRNNHRGVVQINNILKKVNTVARNIKQNIPPAAIYERQVAQIITDSVSVSNMMVTSQYQKGVRYIINKIFLKNVKSTTKKKVIYFIYECFVKEIVPKMFPELQASMITIADILLWCVKYKIFETFGWSKDKIDKIGNYIETVESNALYLGGKYSKKNVRRNKKNRKGTIKKHR